MVDCRKNEDFLEKFFCALFALIMKYSERRSFCAHDLKKGRRSPRAHEIESGAQSAAHTSAAHSCSDYNESIQFFKMA